MNDENARRIEAALLTIAAIQLLKHYDIPRKKMGKIPDPWGKAVDDVLEFRDQLGEFAPDQQIHDLREQVKKQADRAEFWAAQYNAKPEMEGQ